MRKILLTLFAVIAVALAAVPAHAQSGGSGPPFNAQFGSGAPSVNCTPPSQGALARMLYWDTTNFVWYYCSATNTWTKFGTGTGSGTVGNCSTVGGWAYYAATGTTTSCLPFSVAALTALQGTDTAVMTAGTVSGTSALLCTDANGGATTSGCPTGSGTVNSGTAPQAAYYATSSTAVSSIAPESLRMINGGRDTWLVQGGNLAGSTGDTPNMLGIAALSGTGGTAGATVATSTDPPYRTFAIAASTGTSAAISTDRSNYFAANENPKAQFIVKISSTATIRAWWCLTDQISSGTLAASDTPNANGACIAYSTGRSETNFMCASGAAGTWTFTSTGVAADTNKHSFVVMLNSGSNVTCYVDGAHATTVSSNVMASTTLLGWDIANTTLANAAITMNYGTVHTHTDF